jgi:hypothetical protein
MHPFLNRQSKTSLRWYDRESLLTRNTWQCKGNDDLCAFAQDYPSYMILPFQIVSMLKPAVVNNPTAWGLYSTNGGLVVDFSAYLGNLETVQVLSPGPSRTVIALDVPVMLPTPLPAGRYEMRIETLAGTYYSELINIVCGPCEIVAGVYGIDEPEEGLRYAYTDGRVATFCGLECVQPVDANGFNAITACGTGQVMTGSGLFYRWTGTAWVEVEEMPCHYILKWRSCGDVGTVLYHDRGYENILFLKEGEHAVQDPTPIIGEQRQPDSKGKEVLFQARKDVDWTFRLGKMPWYLVDALTETPMLNDVRLRVPNGTGYDKITDIRFTVTWIDTCEAEVTMVFRVDESTANTRCCDEYEVEEQPSGPCSEIDFPEGCQHFSFDYDGDVLLALSTDSSVPQDGVYYTVIAPDGQSYPMASGDQISFDGAGHEGGYCMYSSDSDGVPVAGVWYNLSIQNAGENYEITNLDLSSVFIESGIDSFLELIGIEFDPDPDYRHMTSLGTLFFLVCSFQIRPDTSGMTWLEAVVIQGCIVTLGPVLVGMTNLKQMAADFNALPSAEVNRMLIEVSTYSTITDGAFGAQQNPPAPPSGAGLTAKAELEGRSPGWTVNVDM